MCAQGGGGAATGRGRSLPGLPARSSADTGVGPTSPPVEPYLACRPRLCLSLSFRAAEPCPTVRLAPVSEPADAILGVFVNANVTRFAMPCLTRCLKKLLDLASNRWVSLRPSGFPRRRTTGRAPGWLREPLKTLVLAFAPATRRLQFGTTAGLRFHVAFAPRRTQPGGKR